MAWVNLLHLEYYTHNWSVIQLALGCYHYTNLTVVHVHLCVCVSICPKNITGSTTIVISLSAIAWVLYNYGGCTLQGGKILYKRLHCKLILSFFLKCSAYPDFTFVSGLRQPPRFAALGDDSIQIDCGIPPGRLIQQYFIIWYKDGEEILRQNMPDRSLRTKPGGHYSLNASTLSLVINGVREDDSSDRYRCELTVVDPNSQSDQSSSGTTLSYDILRNNFITLVVLGEL